MRTVAIIAAALVAMPVGAPVGAQDVGQFIPKTELVAYNLVAARMAQCVLKRDHRRAVAVVDLDPATDEYRTAAREIEKPMIACLNGTRSASISSFYLRGAIAEALLRESDDALLKSASARRAVPPVRVVAVDAIDPARAAIGCAVRADPADAGAMIVAAAATPEEMAAFARLVPSLQACVPVIGAVTLRRPTVRPGVAIALYRLGRGGAVSLSSNGAN